MPSLGFGMGLERLFLLLEQQGIELPEQEPCDIYIASMGEQAQREAFRLTQEIREEGFSAECDIVGRSVKAQMKYADKIGARFSMVLGDSELESGKAALKNMSTGEQQEVELKNLLNRMYDIRFSSAIDQIADLSDFGGVDAASLLGKLGGGNEEK